MDDLTVIAEANGGYLMRHQLNDLGYSDAMIRQAMRAGVLRRVRHGTYVPQRGWDLMTESQQHAVITRSILDKLGPQVVATHQSAAALLGFDLYGADLRDVHVTRLDRRRGRREAGVVFHEGVVDDDRDDVVTVGGRLVSSPKRAVFEACSLSPLETGMVLATSAMRTGEVSHADLEEDGHRFDHWPGTRTARLAIRMADPRLETVGEVRSLHMMWRHRIPHPELQREIVGPDGRLIARTDFAWIDDCHTGEFDGLVKYGRLNPYVSDVGQVLTDEKAREDLVRDQQLGMTRWTWAEMSAARQAATAARIEQGRERSRRLYRRNRTTIV
ncbi:type IV toxin-antitoxin system AbiEi family antitoxin domain-containing protein [Aeromicrobium wangtongii]|uniref:Type IV toxin-antitoxin system AbiEi family antitoxin domain-containing protein n=1 Tax=Aeromicrobium wangtongii TaxID=2969247 RepID=A0ABY5MFS7_9ACTN|nr:type IV toxin-antitoxin system AbiEi family antitoxin domain-containing protein [Aeromicrobium wangtongii]MCD9197215.1 type IV toxin-antitoxin system AbiEi family antitoxin domain-containing protein [Aeromicrobium wangtongii]UUP14711.1 type IV toxin-antitoxin system AbiEi family antitoxin domain-containing protein [Aeromicrobium wangtongii]